jgi:hypothetical protein
MEKLTKDNVTLSREYSDNATGFTGKATALCIYHEGDTQVRLEALKPDGTGVTTEWFPVGRLSFTS